jgi:hypothetical protein
MKGGEERVASKSGGEWIGTALNIKVNGEKNQFDVQYFDDMKVVLQIKIKLISPKIN